MTTAAFSSNESETLERTVDLEQTVIALSEIWPPSRLAECTAWIREHQFQRVIFFNLLSRKQIF